LTSIVTGHPPALENKTQPEPTAKSLSRIPESIVISPNGKHILIGFFDSRKVVHLSENDREEIALKHPVSVMAIANDGTFVTACLECRYTIWQRTNELSIETASWTRAVAISPDGNLVVAGGENGSCSIRKRDGIEYHVFEKFSLTSAITTMTLTPSGNYLALGTESGALYLMNLVNMVRWSDWVMDAEVISIALSNDGWCLFARDIRNSTSFWTKGKNTPLKGLEVALSEGEEYAKITNEGVQICGKATRTVDHPGAKNVFISGDGSTVVTMCKRFVKIWTGNTPTTYTLGDAKSHFSLAALSRDGSTIALANDTAPEVTLIQMKS